MKMFLLHLSIVIVVLPGCAAVDQWIYDPWATDFQSAERRARDGGRSMMIVFKDGRLERDQNMESALKHSSVRARSVDLIPCTLYRSSEADRRFADQFYVQRAPALMVLHPDETFHVFAGAWTGEAVAEFLAAAVPPGAALVRNPHIAREVRYRWFITWDGAEEAAQKTDAPVFVAMHRAGTADWRKLASLIETPEVFNRVKDMVHCQLTGLNPLAHSYAAAWGDLQLPALAVVHDGKLIGALEMPTTVEAVVRFIDGSTEIAGPTKGPTVVSGGS